jgi:diguanylate cyclase (GGDEF)-like protein/PAS domain S-box-containing protein
LKRAWRHYILPLAGILLSLFATVSFVGVQWRAHQGEFNAACDNRSFAIQRHIDSNITLLKALRAYAGSGNDRNWGSMHRFVTSFAPLGKDLTRYYWWNPVISPGAAQALEAYPEDSSRVVFSLEAIKRLIAQSASKEAPAATLLSGPKPVCLIGIAVRHDNSAPDSGEGVVLAFDVADMMEDALRVVQTSGIHVSLYDDREVLLHRHLSRSGARALPFTGIFQPAPKSWLRKSSLNFAGSIWPIRYIPIDDYLAPFDTAIAGGVLLLGLVITALLNSYFERRRLESAAATELAMLRSRQLVETECRLEVEIRDKCSAEASLRSSEDRFRRAYWDAEVGMMMTDLEGNITHVNRTICRLTGYGEEELTGRPLFSFIVEEDRAQSRRQTAELFSAAVPNYVAVRRVYRKDGSILPLRASTSLIEDEGRPTGLVALLEDLSGEIEARNQLEFQASHDILTGLINRRAFELALTGAVERAAKTESELVLMYVDLDGFKFVNDSLGHTVGDMLLPAVASRFSGNLPESAILARVGGDEFTIILQNPPDAEGVCVMAATLLSSLRASFVVGGYELFVSASIGICRYPQDGSDTTSLVQHADAAMYTAKRNGKGRFSSFTSEMGAAATARLNMEGDLRRAWDRGEFEVHYQPLVGSPVPRIVRFEALCRWRHPVCGYIRPDIFIPVTEDTGLIVPLGRWVLEQACRQAIEWNRASSFPIRVAVNVSVIQLAQGSLERDVADVLQATGLDPRLLELEITESAMMHNSEGVARVLGNLRQLGISIALDDFGTGYSSLSRLRSMPLDVVKIDKSFIQDLTSAYESEQLVGSLISLAHGIGLQVVSEGVEDSEQAGVLNRLGCDVLQGYLFSRPLDAVGARRFVRESTYRSMSESLASLASAVVEGLDQATGQLAESVGVLSERGDS